MEILGETTNAGALQEFGRRSTRSYIDASFPGELAMLRSVGQPVRALGSIWCVTKGSRHRNIYALSTKCVFRQYTDIRGIVYFVGIALNVTPWPK
eukprot:96399-Pleurochrysis_carterae.AAC.2